LGRMLQSRSEVMKGSQSTLLGLLPLFVNEGNRRAGGPSRLPRSVL
jgi:hypothetical protein